MRISQIRHRFCPDKIIPRQIVGLNALYCAHILQQVITRYVKNNSLQILVIVTIHYQLLPISINANLERQHMRLKKKALTNTEDLQKRKDGTIGVVCASLVVATVISYISIIALQ
jgi:hypothetical protein